MEQLSYHPFGPVTGWTWGNGTPHTRGLDLDGRISAYPLGGTPHSISYDPASRITGIAGSETQSYGYDALDRLTSVTAPGTTQTYSYDPNGNRLTETLGAQTATYGYVAGNNRLQLIADGAHTYTYDARGRMVQATTGALTTTYRYNGLGQRVSKTAPGSSSVSRRFVCDEAGHLIGEYNGAGAPIQETVYLGDLPIAVLSGTNTIHYVHADQINTPRAITDTQGTIRWRWESDPFGGGTPEQDPDGDTVPFFYNVRFPGQYFDTETGLHYNYFRDYDPSLGRYVQSDPIGLAGGINTYAYVGNNPLSYQDLLGLAFPLTGPIAACLADGACAAGIAAIVGYGAAVNSENKDDIPASGDNVAPLPGAGAIIDGRFCPRGKCIRIDVKKEVTRSPQDAGSGVTRLLAGTRFTCEYQCASGITGRIVVTYPSADTRILEKTIDILCPLQIDEGRLTKK